MSKPLAMTSDKLNEILAELADADDLYNVKGLEGTDRCIPYIGWFWRDVNFDADRCTLGDCGQFVGFMEKNKWGYDQFVIEGERWARVKQLLVVAAANPSDETLQAVFDFMQSLRPDAGGKRR